MTGLNICVYTCSLIPLAICWTLYQLIVASGFHLHPFAINDIVTWIGITNFHVLLRISTLNLEDMASHHQEY